MNDADRKYLTEWMGECNHGLWEKWPNGYKCGSCGITFYKKPAAEVRTFTTPDDMMAVKRKLVEKGEW